MKYKALTPMMWTAELEATIEFYTTILGFNLEELNQERGLCSLTKDKVSIMFAIPNQQTPFDGPKFTGSLYINIEEVDTLWAKLQNKATILYPIEDFEYGMREFAILDNNGYVLQFGKELDEEE
jgi:uncharacterized glyoxalase superfamily protein PhnB